MNTHKNLEGHYFSSQEFPGLLAMAISLTSSDQQIVRHNQDISIRIPTGTVRFLPPRVPGGEGVVTAQADFMSLLVRAMDGSNN